MSAEIEKKLAEDSRFDGNDNSQKPRRDYVAKVLAMTPEQLEHETEHKIWLSAFAANNPRSDYHWHVNVCYIVCGKHDGMYQRAYDAASGS